MKGAIKSLLTDIVNLINTEDAINMIAMSLEEFMQSVFVLIMKIQANIMQPVAYTILSIFILLEIQKISTKVEGAGGAPTLGFEMIMKALVKLVICKIVVDNIQVLLNAILELSNMLVINIFNLGQSEGVIKSVVDTFMRYVNDLGFWEQLVVLMILVIVNLVAIVLKVYIECVLYLRFFELYVFSAIAPLPVATLPNQEFSSIGKNFFKGFAAIGLQGVFLALVMTIYPAILENIVGRRTLGVMAIIVSLLLYMLIVLFTINKTKQWAKNIVNVS